MSTPATRLPAVTFSPRLEPDDALAGYWLRQVTLRLRREVSWLWHERGLTPGPGAGALPPTTDTAVESLELSRYADLKARYFAEDETASYLSDLLAPPPPVGETLDRERGSFGWVIEALGLDEPEAFLLALALAPAFDHAVSSVIATCLNDASAQEPNLALAQRLWDRPSETMAFTDPGHPLFTVGLIGRTADGETVGWREPLIVPGLVARQLLFPAGALPAVFAPVAVRAGLDSLSAANETIVASRLKCTPPKRLRVVPVLGRAGDDDEHTVASTVSMAERDVVRLAIGPEAGGPSLRTAATYCWLRKLDLYVDRDTMWGPAADRQSTSPRLPLTVPINLFLGVDEATAGSVIPERSRLPTLVVPALTYRERVDLWRRELGTTADLDRSTIEECARRFRFGSLSIRSVAGQLRKAGEPARPEDLMAACRAEVELDLGELAETVVPRFAGDDLVLPYKQARQLDEIRHGMRSLRAVHYEWGTAEAWREAGIAALFAGPPGTGKSMAAEVLAGQLDLPLYRIDLSQVVNKYIGETEKNLKKVFDACDASDLILLFDEADALFGKRTEVRDAHDRYANLEVSYLLARMERAKGLTILSTNRKKDLDEAFLRRLRYIVDFPQPGVEERRRIWQLNVPAGADGEGLDFDFLAERFPLCGGHIRSAMFNASLQSARPGSRRRGRRSRKLRMDDVLVAVRRELEKANRSISLDQFGAYRPVLEALEAPEVVE